MVEIRFDYEKALACIPKGLEFSGENGKSLEGLVSSCFEGVKNKVEKPEFLKQYEASPDNMETQVDIYAALLNDACARVRKAMPAFIENEDEAKKAAEGIENMLKLTFSTCAFTTVVPMYADRSAPLFVAYLGEKMGEEPTMEKIVPALEGFFTRLGSLEFIKQQKIWDKLIANYEAAFG